MTRAAGELAPLGRYYLEALRLVETPVAGQDLHLMQLLAAVLRSPTCGLFLVAINPARPASGQFRYGPQRLHLPPPHYPKKPPPELGGGFLG